MSFTFDLMFDTKTITTYNTRSLIESVLLFEGSIWRHSSVRLERGIHNPEVPGSIPGAATISASINIQESPEASIVAGFFMPE